MISPDGTRVAVSMPAETGGNRDIWLIDVKRNTRARLTFDAADDYSPVWSADGRSIAFASNRTGRYDLYRKEVGGGGEEVMLADPHDKVPFSWSPDGRALLYGAVTPTAFTDLWTLPVSPKVDPVPFLQTPFNETQADFSPDGRWVAYMSSESGRAEVYIRAFPAGAKWQVTTGGANWPRWRGDGKELFYRSLADAQLTATTISIRDGRLDFGGPRRLFEAPAGRFRFDVSPDGHRFLVNATEDENATPMTLVVNWPAALKK
jgi:Tol biopolymer transport system component